MRTSRERLPSGVEGSLGAASAAMEELDRSNVVSVHVGHQPQDNSAVKPQYRFYLDSETRWSRCCSVCFTSVDLNDQIELCLCVSAGRQPLSQHQSVLIG